MSVTIITCYCCNSNLMNTTTDNYLVIFTDKFNIHIVKQRFDTSKVYIIDIDNINKQNNAITMMDMVQHVLTINPFDSRKFVWLDNSALHTTKIIYSRISDTKIDVFNNNNCCGGGIQSWINFYNLYIKHYKQDSKQQDSKQQNIINRCMEVNPLLFRLVSDGEYWVPNKFIIPRMQAGLGNRLFIYAAALGASSLATTSNNSKSVIILPSHTENTVHGTKPIHNYFYRNGAKAQNIAIENKYSERPYHSGVYIPIPTTFSQNINLLIDGFFQSEKYWLHIRQDIIDQYSCPDFLKDSYRSLYNLHNNNKHAFIHIRRGDYLRLQHHNVNLDRYYRSALQLFPADTHFLIFSDDMNYCRNYALLKTRSVTFVDKSETECLWIMSLCSGAICANSSFSWWGSYLQQNPTLPRTLPNKMFTNPMYRINDFFPQGSGGGGYTIVNV
jgi:hypothetical protein